MAQLSEQVVGSQAGLTPGDSSGPQLEQWIDERYGDLPDATGLDEVSDAAKQAGRLRQWQSRRLAQSVPVLVRGEVVSAVERLAASGVFETTPTLPDSWPAVVTFVWPPEHVATSIHAAVGPGHLPGEDRACAITVDSTTCRIIEWMPAATVALDPNTARLATMPGVELPPWLPAGDAAYEAENITVERLRARIMAAAKNAPQSHAGSLVEQANAAIAGIQAGLLTVNAQQGGMIVGPPRQLPRARTHRPSKVKSVIDRPPFTTMKRGL